MKIAMVSEHASPLATLGGTDAGGQNVHVAALARALAARGHRVDVYTRRDSTTQAERVTLCAGVDVVHVPAGPPVAMAKDELLQHMPAFGEWLTTAWTRTPPDVVHAHFWMSGVAALAAARAVGVPVVQTFHALGSVKRRHQGLADTSPRSRVRTEAALAQQVDCVVATCADEVTELAALGAPLERVRVVPCGVDVQHFCPAGPPWRGDPAGLRPAGVPRLVCVGRLVERKGVDTAVRALAQLPGVELLVAGGPPAAQLPEHAEAQRLSALAAQLGVAERVHLLGEVSPTDVPALLRSADVVVTTPWYEPFGIVPLEAMACGRPLVGSAVGGLLDTVQPGTTGVLVPPREPDALVAALTPLLADPPRRTRLGAAARRRAVHRYSWDRVAAETEDAYATVCTGQREPAEAL
ncbi:glycosyltransferase [Rhodococcus sp. X156]|uniref:glycosyltransferase n=1 Tax=Rhodococcus sp. X156 TaxID=2499145 RepID=UPI000FD89A35|nr:glycosyltransferase [Rhodococcus sp. X156]